MSGHVTAAELDQAVKETAEQSRVATLHAAAGIFADQPRRMFTGEEVAAVLRFAADTRLPTTEGDPQ